MSHVTPFSKSEEILADGESKINHFEKVPEFRTSVDNILRVNHGNQMRLGLMADQKANIMITVASIVFSITIANLDNEVMRWPLLAFAFGSFFALLFAIFAIIPSTDYPKQKGSNEIDRESPEYNRLFFGLFALDFCLFYCQKVGFLSKLSKNPFFTKFCQKPRFREKKLK